MRRRRAASAGVLAAALALSLGELSAGLVRAVPSPVLSVGEAVIDVVPPGLRDAAIVVLGPLSKPVLVGAMLVVLAWLAAGVGRLAARRFGVAVTAFVLLAAVGVLAASNDPQASGLLAAGALAVAAGAGLMTLRGLVARAGAPVRARAGAPAASRPVREPADPPAFDRRSFGRLALGTAAAAAVSAGGGRALSRASAVRAQPATVSLPQPAVPVGEPPPDLAVGVDGLSPLFTPNADFYRIDTALTVPRVDVGEWWLEVSGMVQRPFRLSYAQLLDLPLVETDATLVCVSNEVGGPLVGNARWLGVPLADLLERAGMRPTATQVVGRSVDGWTSGFPRAVALDGRDAIVAVAMNGDPLPARHGFPARLVVPGLYGYVSATKWLAGIELTTWEGFDAYWVPRGWSKEGPVKSQSRIDVPRNGATVATGSTAIAGVAWAQPRGIRGVEVQVDDGDWSEAMLGDVLSDDTWRQWWFEWEAVAGRHTVRVRATDGDGETQVAIASPPQPDGATGLHTIRVTVEDASA